MYNMYLDYIVSSLFTYEFQLHDAVIIDICLCTVKGLFRSGNTWSSCWVWVAIPPFYNIRLYHDDVMELGSFFLGLFPLAGVTL